MNGNASSYHQWDLDMTFADSNKLSGYEFLYPNGMIDSDPSNNPTAAFYVSLATQNTREKTHRP